MEEHVDPYRIYLKYPRPDSEDSSSLLTNSLEDYYEPDQNESVVSELNRLFEPFRTELYFGERHYAPSPTWRDELTTRSVSPPTPPRFAVRVHVFERRGRKDEWHAGRYLGFVSLRPPDARNLRRSDLSGRYRKLHAGVSPRRDGN